MPADHNDLTYYEAVAQIIPILLLAMAVGESRLQARKSVSPVFAVFAVLAIGGVMVAGEVAALRVLGDGSGSNIAKQLTAISVAIGLAVIVNYLAVRIYRDVAGEEAKAPRALSTVVIFAFALVAIAVGAALTA